MALVQLGTLLGTFLSRLSSEIVLIIIAISFIILLRTGHFGMSTHINSQIILITNIIFPFRRLRRFSLGIFSGVIERTIALLSSL